MTEFSHIPCCIQQYILWIVFIQQLKTFHSRKAINKIMKKANKMHHLVRSMRVCKWWYTMCKSIIMRLGPFNGLEYNHYTFGRNTRTSMMPTQAIFGTHQRGKIVYDPIALNLISLTEQYMRNVRYVNDSIWNVRENKRGGYYLNEIRQVGISYIPFLNYNNDSQIYPKPSCRSGVVDKKYNLSWLNKTDSVFTYSVSIYSRYIHMPNMHLLISNIGIDLKYIIEIRFEDCIFKGSIEKTLDGILKKAFCDFKGTSYLEHIT